MFVICETRGYLRWINIWRGQLLVHTVVRVTASEAAAAAAAATAAVEHAGNEAQQPSCQLPDVTAISDLVAVRRSLLLFSTARWNNAPHLLSLNRWPVRLATAYAGARRRSVAIVMYILSACARAVHNSDKLLHRFMCSGKCLLYTIRSCAV